MDSSGGVTQSLPSQGMNTGGGASATFNKYACVILCVGGCVGVDVWVGGCVCVYECMDVGMGVSVCAFVYMCTSVHVRACVCMCACCLRVCICLFVQLQLTHNPLLLYCCD